MKSFSRIFKKVNTHKREVQLYKASSSFLSTAELPFLHHPISSYTTKPSSPDTVAAQLQKSKEEHNMAR
jgi:hypothetical protein